MDILVRDRAGNTGVVLIPAQNGNDDVLVRWNDGSETWEPQDFLTVL